MARVFNAVAAMGIYASLALLGWEVRDKRPSQTRYNFSVVVPPADTGDDDDADAPSANDRHHSSRPADPSDNDSTGQPIGRADPDAPIPI